MVLTSAGTHPLSVSLTACSWHCPLRLHLSNPCRYHNNTLLDPSLYKHESKLVLRNLQRDQAGEYFCKAQSDSGAVKSNIAQLTVIGKPVRDPWSTLWSLLGSKNLGFSVLCYALQATKMSRTPVLPSWSCHSRRGEDI